MLEIGQLVDNKYRILDIAGKGGMSVVYLARNERANKSWAIKEVRKVGEENLEVKKNSLIAETEMLKKLSHPNLPTIVDVIETPDTYLVVMDYIEGNDLGEVLKEYGAQSQDKVVDWGLQLCDVLQYLHTREKPIIYRDLKPANIMLEPETRDGKNKIMLIDFGTAREVKIADANDTISLGTKGYAAPEQFGSNAKTDARTDIYCLGATLYHLVTNHSPVTEVMKPIREINPMLSQGLESIIQKCTQYDPDKRYQSCAELTYALEHYREIDDAYRKKQKRKLVFFIVSVSMVFVSLIVSLFGYISAQNRKAEDIDTYLSVANNETNTREQRKEAYFKAISLEPSDERFYNGLLDLYVSTDEAGNSEKNSLSIIEVTDLDRLSVANENGVQPLSEFQKANKEAYEKFCMDTGISCWYYYDSSTKAESKASEWFRRYLDSVGETDSDEVKFINIYYSIGQCRNEQTARKAELKTKCEELWKLINNLYSVCEQSDDEEAVALGCKEIITEIDNNCASFVELDSITETDIMNMVDQVETLVNNTYTKADSSIKQLIEGEFTSIDSDGQKTDIVGYFTAVKNRIEHNLRGR